LSYGRKQTHRTHSQSCPLQDCFGQYDSGRS